MMCVTLRLDHVLLSLINHSKLNCWHNWAGLCDHLKRKKNSSLGPIIYPLYFKFEIQKMKSWSLWFAIANTMSQFPIRSNSQTSVEWKNTQNKPTYSSYDTTNIQVLDNGLLTGKNYPTSTDIMQIYPNHRITYFFQWRKTITKDSYVDGWNKTTCALVPWRQARV